MFDYLAPPLTMRRNVFTTYDPNLPSGKKFVAVHVQNEDPLYFLVEVKSKVCELFSQITKFLNLLEPELFGLAIRSSGSFVFLDPLEKLSKYAPKQWRTQNNGMDHDGLPLFNVYFRVQFYVDSYLFISDKVAKVLYYHQMRENVLYYGQSIGEERAFLLASYALQADYGNYNAQLHKEHYFQPNHYFPTWVIEELGVDYIIRHLPALHCDHKGMSKSEAQSMYIKEASDPIAPHNFHLYQLVCKKGATALDVWLAITISGIAIYAEEGSQSGANHHQSSGSSFTSQTPPRSRLKTRISFFPWSDIGKLSFEKRKFEIRSTGPQGRKFVYHSASEEISRHLLWFSRASHQFHLMVQQKMKEMLKREAEINRRKYRESCISASSSGNSSGGSSSGQPSSGNTSKSASPFEFSSASSSSSGGPLDARQKGGGRSSDLDITSNSSICGRDSSPRDHQRVSVLSNASSNTTSGIVSDKVHGGLEEDSDRDDLDSDLLMSLNHHHHRHVGRTITLSGCSSSQPVVSLESLALSEPIEHRSCRNTADHQTPKGMNLATNKKHSVSISNIMISSSTTPTSSTCSSEPVDAAYSSSASSPCAKLPTASVSYTPTNEVLITGENSSKVLCLNINDPSTTASESNNNCSSSSPYRDSDEDSSLYEDETDSVFDNTSKSYTSGKSNVTVLSTILKPEAERLLKQGIEAGDAEMMIDDGIDSIDLAELKEFEQAEKEKIILNSLINKLPPPPPLSSSDESSSDSSSDEDEENGHSGRHSCYSPLTQEKMHHLHQTSPYGRTVTTSRTPSNCIANRNSTSSNHIYENLKCASTPTAPGPRSLQVEALVTPRKVPNGLPPPIPLRQCPSLNAFPNGATYSTPRTGMRIGVSSLNRPYAQRTKHSLLTGGCGNAALLPTCQTGTPNCCSGNLFDTSGTLSAGSEPNLYWQSNGANGWPMNTGRTLAANKSDSVFDCRVPPPPAPAPVTLNSGHFSTPNRGIHHLELPTLKHHLPVASQDSNNNIEKLYRPPGAFAASPPISGTSSHDELNSPFTSSSVASHKQNRSTDSTSSSSSQHLKASKSKESGSISDLHQLRQRSSDLNLPLITALFNDTSLMDQLNEQNNKMSQSLQQLPQKVARSSTGGGSGATVERTSTFRVDEAIAKSTLRQQHQAVAAATMVNDNNNNYTSPSQPVVAAVAASRPTSWHIDNSCSGHNRLFTNGGLSPYYHQNSGTAAGGPNKYTAGDFVERLWAEHQLTT